jgi:hypothetical protein
LWAGINAPENLKLNSNLMGLGKITCLPGAFQDAVQYPITIIRQGDKHDGTTNEESEKFTGFFKKSNAAYAGSGF